MKSTRVYNVNMFKFNHIPSETGANCIRSVHNTYILQHVFYRLTIYPFIVMLEAYCIHVIGYKKLNKVYQM